jgi:hypothetical protein
MRLTVRIKNVEFSLLDRPLLSAAMIHIALHQDGPAEIQMLELAFLNTGPS